MITIRTRQAKFRALPYQNSIITLMSPLAQLHNIMKPARSSFQSEFRRLLILVAAICFITGFAFVNAEKTGTTLNITITPEKPMYDESVTITGNLATAEGKHLGNKRVTLEFSSARQDKQDEYEVLVTRETDREGVYTFFRPNLTDAGLFRVTFAGNTNYAPTASEAVVVQKEVMENSHAKANLTGSVIVHTQPSGARVIVDGTERGVTPITVAKLTEGNHTLTVSLAGYASQTMDVFTSPKVDNSLDITLK